VKALLKEAGTGSLKEDLDHLENHDYYFNDSKLNSEAQENNDNEHNKPEIEQANNTQPEDELAVQSPTNSENSKNKNQGLTESEDGVKHLDLYV
jgi:hypothetical protein